MKNSKDKKGKAELGSITLRVFTIGLVLCVVILVGSGCKSWGHPGETRAEAKRRHERVLRINQQEMQADIDKVLMLDRPSHLTDKRLP